MIRLEDVQEIQNAQDGWYGEWVPYDDEKEMEEAAQYLYLWKKFFIKKLRKKLLNTSELINRPSIRNGERATLGIKIELGNNEK